MMLYVFNCWHNPDCPDSLVRRVALHPNADHSRHPHQQDPVFPELGQLATHPQFGIIVAVGAWLTVSPLADALGFVPLPPLYWLLLAIILVCYVVLTQLIKTWFYRRFGE